MARHRLQELPLQLLQTSLLLRITPDLIDYGATLSACEKTGQWRPGLCLLNTLRESELQPDLACFHAFMDGAGKDGWILPIHMLKLGKRETIKKMLVLDPWLCVDLKIKVTQHLYARFTVYRFPVEHRFPLRVLPCHRPKDLRPFVPLQTCPEL